MNFRILRGLIQPLSLGWDFRTKYQAWFDPAGGKLRYLHGAKSVPLIEDSQGISWCYYRVHEDLIIPGYSKMHTDVATSPMTTEPSPLQGREVWSCKTCSVVKERKIQYEFTNTSPKSVKTEAGTVLHLQFSTYKGYDSGYESEEESAWINMDKQEPPRVSSEHQRSMSNFYDSNRSAKKTATRTF
jgi:hypothetical protein